MNPTSLPVGTITFLFTDIEGSTRLVQELGDSWPSVLARHSEIVGRAIEEHDGVVVKTDGDSFFAVFEVASSAVMAAVAAQRGLDTEPWPDGAPVRVRMGLHTGEAALGGSDYVGIDVHRASRIADAAHGGQVVVSEQTAILAERTLPDTVTLHDLGKHRLKDLSDHESIFQVEIEGLAEAFPPLRTLDSIPNNLPPQVTTFIGREREIAEAAQLLNRARILTLTGPGGTGKTRLALQVAGEVADRFEDGVFFAGLSSITEAEVVPSVILKAFGLSASGGEDGPRDRLLEAIRSKNLLLVLDNFEQLLEAASLVVDLARSSHASRFIVTSRAPLHVSGEQELPVPPLTIDRGAGVDDAVASESVRLLLDRALSVRPDFKVTEANVSSVVELVNRLDGLPLAIELVASRLRLFPVETILDRLDARMLGSGSVDLPERQRTINNTIEWSYGLLDEAHRRLFARLSVFAGGARLEEIERLCWDWQVGVDLIDGLSELVDQSLIRTESATRFRMLHVIREYAIERLDESSEGPETRLSHLKVYTDLVESVAPELLRKDRLRWLDTLEVDHDNIRAALEWGTNNRQTDLVLRLGAATWRFWQARGHLHEAERRLEEALELPDGEPRNRAKALEALGGILWWRGDMGQTLARYEQALAMQREIGDPVEVANAMYNYGLTLGSANEDFDAALPMLEEARTIAEREKDENGLGNIAWGLGNANLLLGQYDRALVEFTEAAERYRNSGNEFGLGWSTYELADLRRRQGRYDEAWPALTEALKLFSSHRDVSGVVIGTGEAATIAFLLEDPRRAYRLSGAVQALRDFSGTDLVGVDFNVLEGLDPESLASLTGEDAAAFAEGMAMDLDEILAYVLSGPVDQA